MLRILFDDEIFSLQRDGGISRYFTELLNGLTDVPGMSPLLPFYFTCNRYLAASGCFDGCTAFGGGIPIPGCRTLFRTLNRRSTNSALTRGGYDVVHATWYDDSLLDRIRKARLVVTVHDMVDQVMPEDVGGLPPGYWEAKRSLIQNAAAVVAVSENTAADVARFTGLPRQSIRVIHHGVSDRVRWGPQSGRTGSLPGNFLLVVGNRRAYKNFMGVAAALAEVLRNHPSLALVCFGGGPFTAEERAPFERAGVARALVSMRGDDHALAAAYAHATAFIFPSLYEGFGMPILEAMTNRCPVLLPPLSSFPEIAADAALYFDHTQPGELVDILDRLIGDAALRRRLGERGECRARDFSWRRSVAAHADLYRSLA